MCDVSDAVISNSSARQWFNWSDGKMQINIETPFQSNLEHRRKAINRSWSAIEKGIISSSSFPNKPSTFCRQRHSVRFRSEIRVYPSLPVCNVDHDLRKDECTENSTHPIPSMIHERHANAYLFKTIKSHLFMEISRVDHYETHSISRYFIDDLSFPSKTDIEFCTLPAVDGSSTLTQ